MRIALFAAALALLVHGSAVAGTNLGSSGSPDPDCGERPNPPERPDAFKDNDEIRKYNKAVKEFNAEIKVYTGCVQAWVDNATDDMKLIRAAIQRALEQAKN